MQFYAFGTKSKCNNLLVEIDLGLDVARVVYPTRSVGKKKTKLIQTHYKMKTTLHKLTMHQTLVLEL
jgi:hypothetical protein